MKFRKIIFILLSVFFAYSSSYAKTRKAIYVIVDGIPIDYVERVRPKTIFDIAAKGGFAHAITGGEVGGYTQTPTVSAICYANILTGTWMYKHNVKGNTNLEPNYNYWTLFRIAKEQKKEYKTALFSSWVDNRTVLLGEGKPETNNLKIDYVYDGYELDKTRFPEKTDQLQIFEIDSLVITEAARCVKEKSPDLSWVYLWYTDSGFHQYGDGSFMDKYLTKTDDMLAQIWDAVKYREQNFDEEWMVIIVTDHGRTENGYGHGGQHERERGVWMSTNIKNTNSQFSRPGLALTDINPTISKFMGFEVPRDLAFEHDGISFYGKTDIYDLKIKPYDNLLTLTWKAENTSENATIYVAATNNYSKGGKDQWVKLATIPAKNAQFTVNKHQLSPSKFYKFIVETPNNRINRWIWLK